MSAKVSTFSRGVTFVSSGETGTQANEFEAAIKSVTSSTTIGSCFIYDTRNDSDSGAWRKKARGSWYYETLNTATRGGRREFPSVALIVGDNAGSDATLKVYDLDDVAAPLWMSFTQTGAISWASGSAPTFSAVYALNGRVYLTGDDKVGLLEVNFAADDMRIGYSSAYVFTSGRDIASRNVTSAVATGGDGYVIVNDTVNDVAATVLEGAEIGALGLPIPTIGVACSDGISVIHPNGSVYDLKDSTSANRSYSDVRFRDDGGIFSWSSMNGTAHSWYASSIYSDRANDPDFKYDAYDNTQLPNVLADSTQTIEVGKGSVFTGGSNGLSIVKENLANPVEGASAHITSDYNTGYMLGDIRLSTNPPTVSTWTNYSDGDAVQDRSVKANHLTSNGTVDIGAVATNAELFAFSGFSATEYLSKSYDSSLDLGSSGTVMAWVKVVADSVYQAIMTYNTTSQAQGWQIFLDESERAYFYVYGGNGTYSSGTSSALTTGVWHQVVGVNTGSRLQIYVDGKLANSSAAGTGSMNNGSANLNIGIHYNHTSYPFLGSISLARVSATVATPQQVKEIYEAEAPLFRSGAKCLLQASSDSVLDLSYDKTTDLLSVGHYGTTAGRTDFKNLEAVNTFDGSAHGWSVRTTNLLASNGGVIAQAKTAGTGGVIVDLPAIDVRGDINTADTKLPDDGKFHFSGVTPSSTFARIGMIPIAEGERLNVRAKVTGIKYGVADGDRINVTIENDFVRGYGGNIGEHAQAYKLTDESSSSMDVDLEANHSSIGNHIAIKCTGLSNVRMVWHAEVEVVRSSEKTYER